jgi:SAM-dependent methyltransferase
MVPVDTRCPVCTAPVTQPFAVAHDRFFQAVEGYFELRRCPACGCIFQNPLPSEDQISGFYPKTYWGWRADRPPSAVLGALRRMETAYREFVAMDHVRFLRRCAFGSGARGRLLLDIGCGNGLFLHLARKRGFECRGMDVSGPAVALARERYGLQVRQGAIGDEIWQPGQFDVITMFHVLEHLPDPRLALSYVRRILKPEGSLILQVPNIESMQARCFGTRWYGLDVPRHLINFSPRALDILLKEAGFKIQRRARFSLRDNPASIASSMAPGLDPLGRAARKPDQGGLAGTILGFLYLGLVFLSLPPALFESAAGRGGTLWIHARPQPTGPTNRNEG